MLHDWQTRMWIALLPRACDVERGILEAPGDRFEAHERAAKPLAGSGIGAGALSPGLALGHGGYFAPPSAPRAPSTKARSTSAM